MLPAAILFDLDDTLFDHRRAAGVAMGALHAAHAPDLPFDTFAQQHAEVLETFHTRFLAGELTLDQARVARMQALFARFGRVLDAATAERVASLYREQHQSNRSLVPGAIELLRSVHGHCRLGIVTNNSTAEQWEKLRALDIADSFDAVVISEEAGVTKPDQRIFALALDRLGVTAQESVFIGDSWTNDIAGAVNAGMAAVWLNHNGKLSDTSNSVAPDHIRAQSLLMNEQIAEVGCPPLPAGQPMETSNGNTPALAGVSGQKRPESRAISGVSLPRTISITSLTPATAVVAAIKTVFNQRIPGAEQHEQMETLAT